MSEAPDAPTAWRYLLERTPGTRQGEPVVAEAAHAQPRLRRLYPWPSHGTLKFRRSAPSWDHRAPDDLPFIVCSGPPYKVYSTGYATFLGEADTPAEAAVLVVAHLPSDVATSEE